ncbi:MAG: MutS-like protein [Marteilia pararefringens]
MSEANSPISNSLCTINFCRDENYGIKFGLAVVCLDDFSIQVCEFFDDSSFASLESNLLLLNPKECICINGSSDMKLQKIADNCKILLTNIKKSDNSTSSLAKDLDTLLNAQNSDMDIIKNLDSLVLIKPCTSAIIQMLNLLGSEDNQKRFSLRRYIPTDFMRLDSAAISALNLFPEDKSSNASSKTCILNLINKTITSSGSKLIHKWVHQPLMSVDKINERLDIVEIFSTNLQILNLLRKDHLPSFPNIDLIIRKLVTNRSSLKDCYKLYVGFKRLGMLIESLKECEHDKIDVLQNKFIKPLEVLNVKILKFIEMIECTLDFNKIKDNEFNISGSFNNELESLDNELKSIRYKIDQEFNLTSKELYNGASKNLKLEYNSDQKFFMRVSLKEEKLLRNRASFIIIEVNKSGVKFINNNIQNLNHNYFETSETFNTS